MEPIIKVENLTKTFTAKSGNVEAVRNVNFEVEKGDFICIMGASGSGKTTLVNILSTIDEATHGQIFLF